MKRKLIRCAKSALCIAFALCLLGQSEAYACLKKGLGFIPVGFMDAPHLVQAMNAHWYYTWTLNEVKNNMGVPFVPLISAGGSKLPGELASLAGHPPFPVLLGFNEPDLAEGAALSVEQAIGYWPEIQKHALRMGSPAASVYGPKWLTAFMAAAHNDHLRVDFLAMHYYGPPEPAKLMAMVDGLHERYQLPIWITEFGVLNAEWRTNPNLYAPAQVVEFLKVVIPQLEQRPFVQRFAWWGIGGAHEAAVGASRYFDDAGNLTVVGRYYASVEADAHEPLCGPAS